MSRPDLAADDARLRADADRDSFIAADFDTYSLTVPRHPNPRKPKSRHPTIRELARQALTSFSKTIALCLVILAVKLNQ
jgi:hypothetical protein